MGMHPDQNPDRLVDELIRIHAPWVEYNSARKGRGDILRVIAKALNRVLRDNIAVRAPHGPDPRLDPELFFDPSITPMVYSTICKHTLLYALLIKNIPP